MKQPMTNASHLCVSPVNSYPNESPNTLAFMSPRGAVICPAVAITDIDLDSR